MEPAYGTSPPTARRTVVFPAPFGPMSAEPLALLHLEREAVDDDGSVELDSEPLDGQRRHVPTILVVRRTRAKNGAPKNAVTTPMGSSAGAATVRARTSARTRNAAPKQSESGRTIR